MTPQHVRTSISRSIEQVEQFGGYQDRRYTGNSDDDDNPSIEATTSKSESLVEHLKWQLDMQIKTKSFIQKPKV